MNYDDFSLDDILAEFNSAAKPGAAVTPPSLKPQPQPEPAEEESSYEPEYSDEYAEEEPVYYEEVPAFETAEEASGTEYYEAADEEYEEPSAEDDYYDDDSDSEEYDEDEDEEDDFDDEDESGNRHLFARFAAAPVCFLLMLACLFWGIFNLNPFSGSASQKAAKEAAAIAAAAETPEPTATPVPVESAAPADSGEDEPEATEEPVATPEPEPEKPHYTIAADARYAPAPDQSKFVTLDISEASKVMDVIQQARDEGLLAEDEKVAFDPNAEFYYDSNIQYYYDETILSICWKEVIDGNTCSFNEVKIADASQLRRKLADDTFGSGNSYFASELSKSVNAVSSMNADYYLFRDFGIVVYNGTLYRFNTGTYTGSYKKYNCVDTLFVDNNGDFLFKRLLEEETWESMEEYIADNNINFSISFGPVLVDNYEVQYCDWYPVGEVDKGYSRAGIGQMGALHYLYMNLNHSPEAAARWNINTFAGHFAEKGVMNAYALDGGQTSEVLMNSEPFNYIDYGAERQVSDIIYFGTALSEG